jgi:acyl-coenzyme A synthetase/AMP-(fatty) acid ligase
VRSASAALPVDLYKKLQQRFQVPVIEAFGMTETLSQCFTNPLQGPQKIGTVGLPDGVEARIIEGRLEIQGTTLCVEGWFDTGDLASMDDDGYFTILGRSIDRINIKGYKFDPLSLEKQLASRMPDLGECVVFGRNKISCVYTGSADSDTICKNLKSIHPYCQFDKIQRMDSIPVGPSGKISRSWLQQTLHSA